MQSTLKVKGIAQLNVEVNTLDCIDAMLKELGLSNDCFIKEGAICEQVDVGTHYTEYESRVISKDAEKIKAFEALKALQEYFFKERASKHV